MWEYFVAAISFHSFQGPSTLKKCANVRARDDCESEELIYIYIGQKTKMPICMESISKIHSQLSGDWLVLDLFYFVLFSYHPCVGWHFFLGGGERLKTYQAANEIYKMKLLHLPEKNRALEEGEKMGWMIMREVEEVLQLRPYLKNWPFLNETNLSHSEVDFAQGLRVLSPFLLNGFFKS